MVELKKKYQIGKRRFGLVNWTGMSSLYKKEVLRFIVVSGQTIIGPTVTALLFLIVISLAIGPERQDVLGVTFIEFLAPGLIAMQVIQQSFSHSSSTLLMGKIMGNIVDLIGAPLSAAEVTLSIIFASITRGIFISIFSFIIFSLIIEIQIKSYSVLLIYLFLNGFLMGSFGFIAGQWADKFEHLASVTNFIIVPLSFLSGTFYEIDRLPEMLKTIRHFNPFFYMIDGFRYSFIGDLDGSLIFGTIYLSLLSIIIWFISYLLYKKGYKIKS